MPFKSYLGVFCRAVQRDQKRFIGLLGLIFVRTNRREVWD